jgi:hypothetical protein
MATTTTNFGWDIPQSTDLVKDGATAIAALGQDIDTALVDLKGGTTGQVLAKASATDLDYSWVTTDDTNAIQNAIVDAKGDLIAASAADTPVRLAVGNDGETLVADSSTATGLRYQPTQAAGKNVLINGAFDIWQRGTSFSTASHPSPFFIADRWQATRAGAVAGATISRQTSGAPTGFQYYLRLQRDSGNTNTATINLGQCIETSMSIPYANQTVTLSFYARAGATYKSAANNVNVYIYTGTGTDQNHFSNAYTGLATSLNSTASVTTSWQRFSYTVNLASTVTEFEPQIVTQHSGTAGATDYIDVTGVQIELGSTATAFSRAGGTIPGELAACQRYYYRAGVGTNGVGSATTGMVAPSAFSQTTTTAVLAMQFPVTMRSEPSAIEFSSIAFRQSDGASFAMSAAAMAVPTASAAQVYATVSGVTANRPGYIEKNGTTAGYVAFIAEL